MFYNTGIATYIWIITNRKPAHRKGQIQLIDATTWFKPLRKNMGKKNCELSKEDIERICNTFIDFRKTEESKIFPNKAFGYWKITVERPLRLSIDLSDKARTLFRQACVKADDKALADLVDQVAEKLGSTLHKDYNTFLSTIETLAVFHSFKLSNKHTKLLQTGLAQKDETASPIIKKIHKPGKIQADPLYGFYPTKIDGKPVIVEYETDSELRDTEQVPLLEEGGIAIFVEREVLPHVADAWVDKTATKIGYEISFTRYFYKPQEMRKLENICADILALEKETEGLLSQILVGVAK